MADAEDTLRAARARVDEFVAELTGAELVEEWSVAASELYKEQFAKKENPYGEPWEYRAGDENRTTSYYKFGRVVDLAPDSFTLAVAGPNARRSCVPFEPRGLGAWRPRFQEILTARARSMAPKVKP